MLGPRDLRDLSTLINPTSSSSRVRDDVDINHLEYAYIESCTDIDELQDLLFHLKTGVDGWFGNLEVFIEERLRVLQSGSTGIINEDQVRDDVARDLEEWSNSTFTQDFTVNLTPNRLAPLIEVINTPTEPCLDIPSLILATTSTDVDKRNEALEAKVEGNKCYASGKYKEALHHYTESLNFQKTTDVLNNRSLVHLKTNNFLLCIDDCNESLGMKRNVKALLRRAKAYFEIKKYREALDDVDFALSMDDKCADAQKLREVIQLKRRRKLVIEDVTQPRVLIEEIIDNTASHT